MKRLWVILFVVIGCSTSPTTVIDDFTGTIIHRGTVSGESGLIGGLLLLTAERQITPEMEETFLIRIGFHHTDWLFIESITFKNDNWEKSYKWESWDVSTDVFGGGRITEDVVIILSKEEFTELLSQSDFRARLYGKSYYKTFPFPPNKTTTWKDFLNTKMN